MPGDMNTLILSLFLIGYIITTTTGTSCKQTLTARQYPQYLSSPNYPDDYPNNLRCVYTISTTSYNKRIRVQFLVFHLEGSFCIYDNVTAYDGPNTNSRLMNTWCGITSPNSLVSTGQALTLLFVTDGSTTYRGFRINYYETTNEAGTTTTTPSPTVCGSRQRTAVSLYRYLSSPGYPGNYPNSLRCVYTISTPVSYRRIRVEFLAFELEGAPGLYCQYDYVKAYDGYFTTSRLINTWCGSSNPSTQTSTGQALTLKFVTDGSGSHTGFTIKYYTTSDTGLTSTTRPTSTLCGYRHLTATSSYKYLSSPGYGLYPNNLHCLYTISTTSSTKRIRVTFPTFELEGSPNCPYDYVKAYDGYSTTSRLMNTWCGSSTPSMLTSSGQALTLLFVTDESNRYPGFRIKYSTTSDSGTTGMDLKALVSVNYITSPNYPSDYPSNLDVNWTLHTDIPENAVYIDVKTSRIENLGCSYDYVEAFDGQNSNSTSLGRWCGRSTPSMHSSGQYMYIKFRTDGNSQFSGFRIAYSSRPKSDFPDINVGAIVGGVLGAIAFSIIVAACIKCRRQKSARPPPTSTRQPQTVFSIPPSTSLNSAPYMQPVTLYPSTMSPQVYFTNTPSAPPFNTSPMMQSPPTYGDVIKDAASYGLSPAPSSTDVHGDMTPVIVEGNDNGASSSVGNGGIDNPAGSVSPQ